MTITNGVDTFTQPFAIERGDGRSALIVEDDADVLDTVRTMLSGAGFSVYGAATLAQAEAILDLHDITVAVVDVHLGADDGLALVRQLADQPDTAVVIITGDNDPVDRILGIELGADDYITKPFNGRELLARIKRRADAVRLMRGSRAPHPAELPHHARIGQWTVDEQRQAALDLDNRPADLSHSEFRTLLCLVRSRGTVLSREDIYAFVTGRTDRPPLDRSVDVQISNLRRKLGLPGNAGIRTVHRVGYIID
ncbi:MAG: two-component system response regulator TorR [Acuticoccus sp.]